MNRYNKKKLLKFDTIFQDIVESEPGFYWVNNLENNETIYISPSYESIFQQKLENYNNDFHHFLSTVHADDKQKFKQLYDRRFELGSVNIRYRMQKSNGGIRWIFAKVRIVSNQDQSKLEYGYAEDITDVKNKEEELIQKEFLYNQSCGIANVGTYSVNLFTNIWTKNEIADDLFGVDSDSVFTSEKWSSMIFPDDFKDVMRHLLHEVINRNFPFDKIYRIIREKDKKIRWIHGKGILQRNDQGIPLTIVGTIRDISIFKQQEVELTLLKKRTENLEEELQLKKTEVQSLKEKIIQLNQELAQAKVELEDVSTTKTEFLANMSHEIRTPLNGIIGFTNLLQETNTEEIQFQYLSTVNESAHSLMQVVTDVLDFSKIELGNMELEIAPVNIFELGHQIIDLFKFQAIQKKLELKLQLDPSIPELVLTDALRLKQVLVNLVSNAIKFTEKGGVDFQLKVGKTNKLEHTALKFSIKDSGIGMEKEEVSRIFESFVKADSTNSRKFSGTSIGLAISNQLLGLMDSKLELKSAFGLGSEFFFTIEVQNVIIEKQIEIMQQVPEEKNSLSVKEPKSILLAEDNKINLFLAKTLVNKIFPNCVIQIAENGQEAVEEFKKAKFDIVLMDIQMPVKNGYEATEEIRAFEAAIKTPIIALTAGVMAGEKEKCFEYGMNDYLSKPINFQELKDVLEKWCS